MSERRTQWLGGAKLQLANTDASSPVADIIEMIPAELSTAPVGQSTKYTVEAIYLHTSTRRLLTTTVDALGFVVWVAQVAETGNTPVQSLDALSTTNRAYGNSRIMMMKPLAVPPLLGTSDLLAFTVDDRVIVAHHEFQASRTLDRSNQVLAMQVNCDVSAVCQVFCQWRVLVSYAG